MEVTKDEYDKAVVLLSKVELAQKVVEAYEDQTRWTEDPVAKIMEESKPVFVEGETVRGTDLLWRATKLRYVHEKGTVERVITYSSEASGSGFFKISTDKSMIV